MLVGVHRFPSLTGNSNLCVKGILLGPAIRSKAFFCKKTVFLNYWDLSSKLATKKFEPDQLSVLGEVAPQQPFDKMTPFAAKPHAFLSNAMDQHLAQY